MNSEHFPSQFSQDDDNIDFKRYLSLFISNWYWFAVFLFIAFTISYGVNRYSESFINVTSSLLIRDELQGGFTGMDPIFPGTEAFRNRQNLNNEIGILKSHSLHRKVIDSLEELHVSYTLIGRRGIAERTQYKTTPFFIVPDKTTSARPGHLFSVDLDADTGDFKISLKGLENIGIERRYGDTIYSGDLPLNDYAGDSYKFVIMKRQLDADLKEPTSSRYQFYFPNRDGLASQYRNRLQVNPIDENSTLVTLSLTGAVVEQEIDYLNALMELYSRKGLEDKNVSANLTLEFIKGQLKKIHDSLEVAEEELQDFRLKNKLIDISSEGAILKGKLERFDTEKMTLELQMQYFAYLKEYLSSRSQTGDIISPSILNIDDPNLERLVGELALMQQQQQQLTLNLSPDLAIVKMLDEKISNVKLALNENINSSIDNIQRSIDDINIRLNTVSAELVKLPETEKGLIRIQRDFELNNTVYTYLLEKREEAGIALASNVSDNKIVDRAGHYSAYEISPKTSRNNLLALILGFMIPILSIFMIDYLNNKVIDKKDIERSTKTPVLGFISHNNYKSETPVIQSPSSTLSESFRSVRTALKFYTSQSQVPVVAISSTVSSEGKTFISVNLAVITAMLGKRVLIVGLDLRKPKIHKLLEVANDRGMSNYLSGNLTFDESIQATTVENLFYAPSGPVPPNPAELIESDNMRKFLDEAKTKFDYIIIDTPPVAIVTDALLLSPYVDANIFVVRQRYSSKNTLSLIQDFYETGKLKNMSIIINDISLTGYYGYGLRYGYSVRYGGYSYGYNFYGDYVYSRYGYGSSGKDYYTDRSYF